MLSLKSQTLKVAGSGWWKSANFSRILKVGLVFVLHQKTKAWGELCKKNPPQKCLQSLHLWKLDFDILLLQILSNKEKESSKKLFWRTLSFFFLWSQGPAVDICIKGACLKKYGLNAIFSSKVKSSSSLPGLRKIY